MVKLYRYPTTSVLMNFGLIPAGLLFMSLLVLLLLMSHKNDSLLFTIGVLSIFAVPALISIIPIVSMCKTIMMIDADGLHLISPFKDLKFRWSDIREISKVNVLTSRYYSGPPRDIRILLGGTKKINILHIIVNCEKDENDGSGMAEFESDLKRYVGDAFPRG